jgi:SAM-dependent methyltransferase
VSFDVAAEAYERFMGRWSRNLAPRFVQFAKVRAGQRVLDVGCGPGALTAELAARVGPERVAAVDPSAPFTEAARSRHPGVDVRRATADALPFRDAEFDATLAQLVVHFMPDPVAGLTEMARVTRDGGVVAGCVWDYAGDSGPLGPFWVAARELDPDVDDESLLAGTREGHLAELLDAAGMREVEATSLRADRRYADFDEWWTPFTESVGPAGAYLASLDPERRAELRERCRALLPSAPFVLTARAWAARGVV